PCTHDIMSMLYACTLLRPCARSYLLAERDHRPPFFFQAEDGIRDRNVTGVQTCALPISTPMMAAWPSDRRGTECTVPMPPGLVNETVVPEWSSMVSLLFKARCTRSS